MPRPYPPITGNEGINPSRRYKWFRPRQAVRGHSDFTSGVNRYNIQGVQNNSNGSHVLVVRDWIIMAAAVGGGAGGWYASQTSPGTSGSLSIQNYMATAGQLPGTMVAGDSATSNYPNVWLNQINPGQFLSWPHDWPFGVVEPGWCLLWVSAGQNISAGVSMIWEAIPIEELDYFEY
jgi:hypothetical protein